jgi:hypothetical protein
MYINFSISNNQLQCLDTVPLEKQKSTRSGWIFFTSGRYWTDLEPFLYEILLNYYQIIRLLLSQPNGLAHVRAGMGEALSETNDN